MHEMPKAAYGKDEASGLEAPGEMSGSRTVSHIVNEGFRNSHKEGGTMPGIEERKQILNTIPILGPAPGTSLRKTETPPYVPFLFAGVYHKAPPAVNAFCLDRLQRSVGPGGRDPQPLPVL